MMGQLRTAFEIGLVVLVSVTVFVGAPGAYTQAVEGDVMWTAILTAALAGMFVGAWGFFKLRVRDLAGPFLFLAVSGLVGYAAPGSESPVFWAAAVAFLAGTVLLAYTVGGARAATGQQRRRTDLEVSVR